MKVSLRPATAGDAEMVFRWRNDPFLVPRASSQRKVTWEEHERWFRETLSNEKRWLYIIEIGGEPGGQVRFDAADSRSRTLSISLIERFTGQGAGVEAIRMGCEAMFREGSVEKIIACVREDNAPARTAFRRAGFSEEPSGESCPPQHVAFVMRRQAR